VIPANQSDPKRPSNAQSMPDDAFNYEPVERFGASMTVNCPGIARHWLGGRLNGGRPCRLFGGGSLV